MNADGTAGRFTVRTNGRVVEPTLLARAHSGALVAWKGSNEVRRRAAAFGGVAETIVLSAQFGVVCVGFSLLLGGVTVGVLVMLVEDRINDIAFPN